MTMEALHGSRVQTLCTPPKLLEELDFRYGLFDVDLAATTENRVARFHLGPGSELHGDATHPEARLALGRAFPRAPASRLRCFCNPPFAQIPAWVDLAFWVATQLDGMVVLLVPSRVGTEWWHRLEHPEDGVVTQEDRILADRFPGSKPLSSRLAYLKNGELATAPFEHSTIWVVRKRLYAASFR